jgi:hypothetical protein
MPTKANINTKSEILEPEINKRIELEDENENLLISQ